MLLSSHIENFGLYCDGTSIWPSCLSLAEAFITTFFMVVVMLVIVLGNLMVVLTIKNDPKLWTQRQNWLIVSLAFADLLVGLLIMPLTLTREIVGLWILGDLLCELWLALDVLFVTASILHICIISLDRYWSVTYPLTYPSKRTPLRICIMIGVAWLLSLLISIPPLIGWKLPRNPGKCSVSEELGYVLYSSLGSFYIPVAILIMAYWRIYMITKSHGRQRLKHVEKMDEALCKMARAKQKEISRNGNKMTNTTTNSEEGSLAPLDFQVHVESNNISVRPKLTIGSRSSQENLVIQTGKKSVDERKKVLKVKERQATLLLGLILGAFIASWLPFFMMYVLGAFNYRAPTLIFKYFFWLGYCNSGINPIIYTIFNREFKRALWRTIRRCQQHFSFLIHLI